MILQTYSLQAAAVVSYSAPQKMQASKCLAKRIGT